MVADSIASSVPVSHTPMSKLLVVVGATGGQGGSIIDRFLKDPEFKIRGITRNTESNRAKALLSKGIEVVAANSDDPASLDKAFKGAYAIFAVTDYYDNFFKLGAEKSMAIETQQGMNMAKAASKVPTLQRYIWSTLIPSSDLSDGNVIVPHFEGKAQVDKFIQKDPELLAKTTFALFTIFATNLTAYSCFKPIYHVRFAEDLFKVQKLTHRCCRNHPRSTSSSIPQVPSRRTGPWEIIASTLESSYVSPALNTLGTIVNADLVQCFRRHPEGQSERRELCSLQLRRSNSRIIPSSVGSGQRKVARAGLNHGYPADARAICPDVGRDGC